MQLSSLLGVPPEFLVKLSSLTALDGYHCDRPLAQVQLCVDTGDRKESGFSFMHTGCFSSFRMLGDCELQRLRRATPWAQIESFAGGKCPKKT